MTEHSSPDGSNYRSSVDDIDRPEPSFEERRAAHFADLDRIVSEDADPSVELDELGDDEVLSGVDDVEGEESTDEGAAEGEEQDSSEVDEDVEDDDVPVPRPPRIPRVRSPRSFEYRSEDDGERTADELDAREVLGRFRTFHATVKEGIVDSVAFAERKVAQAKNVASSPKLAILSLRERAAANIDGRMAALQDRTENKYLGKVVDKVSNFTYKKYSERNAAANRQKDKMKGRLDTVDRAQSERLKAIDDRQQELIEAKVVAVERKLIRQEQRRRRLELRGERGLSSADRERLIKALSIDDKKRIRSAAVTALENR